MADVKLPPELESLELDLPDLKNPEVNSRSNENGLSDWQRFVVKNVFDTQPTKRKFYMRRLGYEVGKDGESYRPIGSDADFQPIEEENTLQGRIPLVGGFIPVYNVFDEKGRAELVRDLKDVAFDTLVEGPIVGAMAASAGSAGAAAGAGAGAGTGAAAGTAVAPGPGTAAGAAAGGGIGAILAGVPATITGGAAGKATSEVIKSGLGEFFLDEDIPLDLQEVVYQSFATGVLGGLGRGAGNVFKNWKKMSAEKVRDSLKQIAMQKSNGTWNDELATDFAQNPEKYTPEAVKGSTKKLLEFSNHIFGTDSANPKSTRELKGGVAKGVINPLNEMADLEIKKMSQMPEANFSVEDLVQTIKDRVQNLKAKKFRTQDENRAIDFLNSEVESLKKKMRIEPEVGPAQIDEYGRATSPGVSEEAYKELTFQEGRDFLKRLQNAAYEEGPVKDNGVLKQVTHGLKEFADAKAADVGSNLPQINAKRSEILRTYQNMQSLIKDGSMQSAYVGKDSVAKQRVQAMFDEADRVLGTDLSNGAKSLQFQSAVEKVYESPSSFGSGAVIGDAMREGIKRGRSEGIKGFGVGSILGAPFGKPVQGGVVGATLLGARGIIKGAKEGATFSSPDTLVKNFSKIKTRLSDLNANPSYARQLTTQAILSAGGGQVTEPVATNYVQPQAAVQAQPSAPAEEAVTLPPELEQLEIDLPENLRRKAAP